MNRNNSWKWALVVFIVAWSIWELYPPTGRNVVEVFQERAVNKDEQFNGIVQRAQQLEKEHPERSYQNLVQAVGTNNLKPYFGSVTIPKDADPTRAILKDVQKSAAGKIRLGLDLRGGTSFLMGVDTTKGATNQNQTEILSQAAEVLRRRVDKLGVAEPMITPVGANRILVQLPGISEADKDEARIQLSKAAFLEFRLVHPNSDDLIARGETEAGYVRMTEINSDPQKQREARTYLISKKTELTGKNITRAMVVPHQLTGKPQISFEMDSQGTTVFAQLTRENSGRFLAIILDGELYSAPRINEPIETGRGEISGDFSNEEAFQLANILENPLEVPVKIEEERSVDPSLGADSIKRGMQASIWGAVGVAVFMMVFYMLAGSVANVALLLNVLILMGVMCSIDATLTLPGIAGIALTIGMAVDANVLIFERLREELAQGKSLKGALSAAYSRAFGTIFDSHVTTLISSIILINLGTGPIKGFGVTLTIGVAASLFTALVVTRLIFDFMLSRNLISSLKMLPIVKITNVNFIGQAKIAWAVSIITIVIGMVWLFKRGDDVLGPDFKGGDQLTISFKQKVEVDELRDLVTQLKVGEPLIQYQKNISDGSETLQILTEYNSAEKVTAALKAKFPQAEMNVIGTDRVGPSVGEEIQSSAVAASILAMMGILLYVAVRYEFSFAIGAVVAVIHDVLVTMGLFFLTGRELSAPMVAAILTIIGYSINDKIVILDRIREDLKLGTRGSFKDVMNLALNQTLSRTLITGGSVILATLALYIFGGTALNDFAFTFLVGILVGTYSSIYIATTVVLWWHKGERPKMAAAVVEGGGDAAAGTAPAKV